VGCVPWGRNHAVSKRTWLRVEGRRGCVALRGDTAHGTRPTAARPRGPAWRMPFGVSRRLIAVEFCRPVGARGPQGTLSGPSRAWQRSIGPSGLAEADKPSLLLCALCVLCVEYLPSLSVSPSFRRGKALPSAGRYHPVNPPRGPCGPVHLPRSPCGPVKTSGRVRASASSALSAVNTSCLCLSLRAFG